MDVTMAPCLTAGGSFPSTPCDGVRCLSTLSCWQSAKERGREALRIPPADRPGMDDKQPHCPQVVMRG